MRVRILDLTPDENGVPQYDMTFGRSLSNFYINVPEAPAQCVMTRLQLYLGQWFLNLLDGTKWRTRILGFRTGSTRNAEIRSRVLGTQGVNSIESYSATASRQTRAMGVTIEINTIYGPAFLNTVVQTPPPEIDVRNGR